MPTAQSFPRHSAQTQGFTLGAPRNVTVTPDGEMVLFLRSTSGTDRSNALWMMSIRSGEERLLVDPAGLLAEDAVTAQEQARRERARERATGITGYAIDRAGQHLVFSLAGRLFHTELATGSTRALPTQQPVFDPRLDPTGRRVAYLNDRALRVLDLDDCQDRAVAEDASETVSWGAAEFVAAEEMDRDRGYWWSPDGTRLLAARVDEAPVLSWYLSDPTYPEQTPRRMRYPRAGTDNADVALFVLGLDGHRVPVRWDRESFPYLVAAHWSAAGPPLVTVQSRDQRIVVVFTLDPEDGSLQEIHRDTDPHWVEIKHGYPAWTPAGQLVTIGARDGAYRLLVDGLAWTDSTIQVRSVLDIGADDILVSASESDPTEVHLYRVSPTETERLTHSRGVHSGVRSGRITVINSSGMADLDARMRIFAGTEEIGQLTSVADTPDLPVHVEIRQVGERALATALLLPNGYRPEHGKLPVLVDPYGGPQAQRVLARQRGYLTSQWFADQGFAVLVTDGRGTGGRGPEWDRAIARDVAGPVLDDQIDALHAVAAEHPELDLDRVAIRGWSFGGYLAALGVLRRPDIFHAAIAGAAVCDWRLYDTHYTERYLGDPNTEPEVYEANSLLRDAAKLSRPLLIIHGTLDDNVALAHSLRLSAALTAAGRPHSMLPLPAISHMPTEENTTENLLLLQVDFLHRALRPS